LRGDQRASVAFNGAQRSGGNPAFPGDGRFVAFASIAPRAFDDTNNKIDVCAIECSPRRRG
jgi:hypothetical protein